jgi:hypothetical protein
MRSRIILVAYCSSLLSSVGLAYLFYQGFLEVSDNTLGLEALRSELEFLSLSEAARIFSDFLTDFGLQALLYLFILYFYQHFFTAGLLDAAVSGKLHFRRFIRQGSRRFASFFGLHLLLSTLGLLLLSLSLLCGSAIHTHLTLPDHRNVFLSYALPLSVFFLAALFLYALWDYTRIRLVKGEKLPAALRAAGQVLLKQRVVWRNFGLFLALMLLSTVMYRLVSPYLYPLLFLAQQAFLLLRVSLRWGYLHYIARAKPLPQ